MAIEYAPRLALAIIVLLIGLWIVNKIVKIIGKALERKE